MLSTNTVDIPLIPRNAVSALLVAFDLRDPKCPDMHNMSKSSSALAREAPLAANLARRGHSVLVLEAGDDQGHNLNTQIPAFHTIASDDPAVRWDFFVKHFDDEEQAARDPKMTWTTPGGFTHVDLDPPQGSKQKGILYSRAATLGGCTMHHAMMTFLPPDEDWLHIQYITDDGSWGPSWLRKYFERVERCGHLLPRSEGHGFYGWLETSHPDSGMIESLKRFVDAALSTPKDELERFNIRVLVNLLGVGTNLQDNYETHVLSRSPRNIPILANSLLGAAGGPFLKRWLTEGKGPYAVNGGVVGIKKKSQRSRYEEPFGSYDLFLFGGPISFTGFFPGYSKASSSTFDKFCWNVLKVHPRNECVGTVSLRSGDPRHTPDVNFKFFDERSGADHDFGAMAEGVEIAREMFSKVSEVIGEQVEEHPGPHSQGEVVKQIIKDRAFSHHATGTCEIGGDNDPFACLDSKFRVRGLDGLRVVDASVFLRVLGAYPVLPIFMISEKAADVILEEARYR